ncbi:MAG: hypothetical protein P8M22_02475 [Phycisphaerales bacterium]|nr:hypothetical protein [Phycisphaerales bacterium]
MSKPGNSFAGIVILVLLCGPVVLSPFLFERNATFIREVENREPTSFPEIESASDTLDTAKWDGLSSWLREHVPFRGDLIAGKTWVEIELLGQRRIGAVDRGDDGWLFILQSYGGHWHQPGRNVTEAIDGLNHFLARNANSSTTFRVLLTPDKHTIYPEHLTRDGRRDISHTAADRARFEEWFAQEDDDRIIDLHAAMRESKENVGKELYFRDDTHQNWHGGSVMAKAIVDSIQPGTWDDSSVIKTQTIKYPGDLRSLCGLTSMPMRQKEVMVTARAGVLPQQVTFEGNVFDDFEAVDKDPHSWQCPVRSTFASTEGLPLIPGRTLIMHDSCIGSIARPLIRPYFEDITFMHYSDATPESIEQALEEYDTVVLEVVERIAPETFVRLMADPDPDAPSLVWQRDEAKPVWSLLDTGPEKMFPADGVVATLENGRITTQSTGISSAIVFNDLQLPADHRHVARILLDSPGLGQSSLFWSAESEEMSPDRSDSKPIRGGLSELFLEMRSDQPITSIMFEPGGGTGEHVIESIEIRSIPLDSEPPTSS